MANTKSLRVERVKRVWTLYAKLYVPHGREEIAFASPAFGPNTHQKVGEEILSHNLKVPTGDYTISLLHPVYCNSQNSDEEKNVRNMMRNNWLCVFDLCNWIDKGVYVVQDLKAEGRSKPLDVKDLEKRLKGGKEIDGIRFSVDKTVRFAPKETYRLGEHTSDSLSKDGFVIAKHDVDGAKKLGEISFELGKYHMTYGLTIQEGNPSELRVSALCVDGNGLHVDGDDWDDYYGSLAFGVL